MTGTSGHPPFVSVIVPVKDTPDRVRRCLDALERQTYPHDRFEVLVVDNGSPQDLTPVCARRANVHLLLEPRPGSYAARNRGLEQARGTVLAFTDADCMPQPSWLDTGVRRLGEKANSGFVGGHIELFHPDPERPTAASTFDAMVSFPQDVDVLRNRRSVTANLMTWRHVVDQVGFFDERLQSMGDMEFTRRISDAGFEPIYGNDVVVRHATRTTMSELVRKQRRVARGRYLLATRLGGGGVVDPGLDRLLRRYSTYLWAESLAILRSNRPHTPRDAWTAVAVNVVVRLAGFLEVLRLAGRDALSPRPRWGRLPSARP